MKTILPGILILIISVFTNISVKAAEISTVELMYLIQESSLPEKCHLEHGSFEFRDEFNEFLKISNTDQPLVEGVFFSSSMDNIQVTSLADGIVQYSLERDDFESIKTHKYQIINMYDRSKFKMLIKGSVIISLQYITDSSNGRTDRNSKVECER